jgi:hypothetical protein
LLLVRRRVIFFCAVAVSVIRWVLLWALWVEMVAAGALAQVNSANKVFIAIMAKRFSIDNPPAKFLLPTVGRFPLGQIP